MTLDPNTYRTKLRKLREHVAETMRGLAKEALPEPNHQGAWSGAIDDTADSGSRETDEALTLGLVANEEGLMEAIDGALARLDQGTFGKCDGCGKQISKERLDAIPYASECIHCARANAPRR